MLILLWDNCDCLISINIISWSFLAASHHGGSGILRSNDIGNAGLGDTTTVANYEYGVSSTMVRCTLYLNCGILFLYSSIFNPPFR